MMDQSSCIFMFSLLQTLSFLNKNNKYSLFYFLLLILLLLLLIFHKAILSFCLQVADTSWQTVLKQSCNNTVCPIN